MTHAEQALRLLPPELRRSAERIREKDKLTELHLRLGRVPTYRLCGAEQALPDATGVTPLQLARVVENACGASPYAVQGSLARGYITAPGGIRVGVCGRMAQKDERKILGEITSLSIRIPREIRDIARPYTDGSPVSTLIVSPPGGGKTTLLRDMVRLYGDRGVRVALCDERGEVAGWDGHAFSFDLGRCADILTDCPKAEGAMLLLRVMSPEVLAMDEITDPADTAACLSIAHCGVSLLATCHAADENELFGKELYRPLLNRAVFQRIILISADGQRRRYREQWL